MRVTWSVFQLLTEANIQKNAPAGAGVYTLWVKFPSGRRVCCYVEQTEDLKQRLLQQIGGNEANACIRNYRTIHVIGYIFAVIPDPSDRIATVKFLYDRLRPDCNEVDPGGSPVEVNLPLAG